MSDLEHIKFTITSWDLSARKDIRSDFHLCYIYIYIHFKDPLLCENGFKWPC